MGRPREWRKQVKKLRRKRIRTEKAKERDLQLQKELEEREKLPGYAAWLSEQKALEIFHREKQEREKAEVHQKWLEAEKEAEVQWRKQQERIALARAEKLKQEALIREEWEKEQKKQKEEKERKKKEKEEKERLQIEFLAQIDAYINGSGPLPEGAVISTETHPSEPDCPFFSRVGACRFWDFCSRNHKRPGISKVLLFPGFFSHISLNQLNESNKNEYDTDVGLEYNDEEAYGHFLEFYDDVVKELKTFGELVQFKVCCNAEPHLRGNVYAQYSRKRAAMKAYRALQGRYYSGKQIKVEFTKIPSWKNAICGLFQGSRCPKGKNCNFLHVFWNPTPEFKNADKDIFPHKSNKERSRSPSRSTSRRHWRWSESPEPVSLPSVSRRHNRDSSEDTSTSRTQRKKDNQDRRKSRSDRKHKDEAESDFSDKYGSDRKSWKKIKRKRSDCSDNDSSDRASSTKCEKKCSGNVKSDSSSDRRSRREREKKCADERESHKSRSDRKRVNELQKIEGKIITQKGRCSEGRDKKHGKKQRSVCAEDTPKSGESTVKKVEGSGGSSDSNTSKEEDE